MLVHLVVARAGVAQVADALVAAHGVLEESHVPRGVVAAAANPPAHEHEAAVEPVPVAAAALALVGALPAALDDLHDFLGQLGGHVLVGVEDEHPLVAPGHVLERPVLLLGPAGLGVMELVDLGAHGLGEGDGSVGRLGIDDDDLVGPLEASQALDDVALFVLDGHEHGDADGTRGGPVSGREAVAVHFRLERVGAGVARVGGGLDRVGRLAHAVGRLPDITMLIQSHGARPAPANCRSVKPASASRRERVARLQNLMWPPSHIGSW